MYKLFRLSSAGHIYRRKFFTTHTTIIVHLKSSPKFASCQIPLKCAERPPKEDLFPASKITECIPLKDYHLRHKNSEKNPIYIKSHTISYTSFSPQSLSLCVCLCFFFISFYFTLFCFVFCCIFVNLHRFGC